MHGNILPAMFTAAHKDRLAKLAADHAADGGVALRLAKATLGPAHPDTLRLMAEVHFREELAAMCGSGVAVAQPRWARRAP